MEEKTVTSQEKTGTGNLTTADKIEVPGVNTEKDIGSVIEQAETSIALTTGHVFEDEIPFTIKKSEVTEPPEPSEILTEIKTTEYEIKPVAIRSEQAKPTEAALDFLKSIDRKMLEFCCFEDKLILVSHDGKSVGEYRASVEQIPLHDEEVLFVRASACGKIDETATASSVTAYILPENLTLLKQEYHHFCKTPEGLDTLTILELNRKTKQLEVKRKITDGKKIKTTKLKFKQHAVKGLVTEATNIVLQRLLVKAGVQTESMDFVSLDINGHRLAPTSYRSLPMRKQMIGKTEAEVYGLERHLKLTEELPLAWNSFFTENTLMTFRVQLGSPLTMIIDKLPLPTEAQCIVEPKQIPERRLLTTTDDTELKSELIRKKTEMKSDHNSYLRQHPEAKAILRDFLQFLLLRRPSNVFGFAARYFSDFSSKPFDLSTEETCLPLESTPPINVEKLTPTRLSLDYMPLF